MPRRPSPEFASMPSTHWSMIGRIQDGTATARLASLSDLLQRYLPALRAHLVWKRKLDHHFAEDVLQDFVANKVLERDLISTADQSLGKFRSLLLRSLDNYVIDKIRRRRPDQRTGGGAADIDVSEYDFELRDEPVSDTFDLAWAQRVLVEALESMRKDCLETGQVKTWEIFQDRIVAPALDPDAKPIPYDQLLARYEFESPQQAANQLVTAKRRFRRHLESVITQYAAHGEVAAEIQHLRMIVAATGGHRLDMTQVTRPASETETAADSDFDAIDPHRFRDPFPQETPGSPWMESELGEILRDQLTMPAVKLVPDLAPEQLPFPQVSLQDIFRLPDPPLDVLRKTKEYARHCAREPDQGTMPPEIAAVLYSTCIAVALERLNTRITKSDDEVLCLSFRVVAGFPWIPEEIRALIENCRQSLQPQSGQEELPT